MNSDEAAAGALASWTAAVLCRFCARGPDPKAPEDWRTPKPRGVPAGSWKGFREPISFTGFDLVELSRKYLLPVALYQVSGHALLNCRGSRVKYGLTWKQERISLFGHPSKTPAARTAECPTPQRVRTQRLLLALPPRSRCRRRCGLRPAALRFPKTEMRTGNRAGALEDTRWRST